jgi:predicted acylesterase/phospholipase RssA
MTPLYLALSGGGAHAAAHAGVLRALDEEGVPVAGIAGVSGGALVAAAGRGARTWAAWSSRQPACTPGCGCAAGAAACSPAAGWAR